jgi:hypothetical protein
MSRPEANSKGGQTWRAKGSVHAPKTSDGLDYTWPEYAVSVLVQLTAGNLGHFSYCDGSEVSSLHVSLIVVPTQCKRKGIQLGVMVHTCNASTGSGGKHKISCGKADLYFPQLNKPE